MPKSSIYCWPLLLPCLAVVMRLMIYGALCDQPRHFPPEAKMYPELYWYRHHQCYHHCQCHCSRSQLLWLGTIPFRYFLEGFWVLCVNKPFLSHAWIPESRQQTAWHKLSNLPRVTPLISLYASKEHVFKCYMSRKMSTQLGRASWRIEILLAFFIVKRKIVR